MTLISNSDVHTFQVYGIHPSNPQEARKRAIEAVKKDGLPILFVSEPMLTQGDDRGPYYSCYVTTEGPWPDDD